VARALSDLHMAVESISNRVGKQKLRHCVQAWHYAVQDRRGLAQEIALKMAGRYLRKPFLLWRSHARRTLLLRDAARYALALHVGRHKLTVDPLTHISSWLSLLEYKQVIEIC
jgi:hypothetical protein